MAIRSDTFGCCSFATNNCIQKFSEFLLKISYTWYKTSYFFPLRQLDDNLLEGEPYNRLAQKIQRRLKWRVAI